MIPVEAFHVDSRQTRYIRKLESAWLHSEWVNEVKTILSFDHRPKVELLERLTFCGILWLSIKIVLERLTSCGLWDTTRYPWASSERWITGTPDFVWDTIGCHIQWNCFLSMLHVDQWQHIKLFLDYWLFSWCLPCNTQTKQESRSGIKFTFPVLASH